MPPAVDGLETAPVRHKTTEESYTAVEGFLDLVLRRKIRKNIKSKTSKDKSLTQIVKKEDDNKDYRTISFVVASLLSILTSKQCFEQPAASFLVCSLIFIEYYFK